MLSCTALPGCACHNPALHETTRRVALDTTRRGFIAGLAALGLPIRARAETPRRILLINARIFDGTAVSAASSLLTEGNRIRSLAPGTPDAPENTTIIDCGGRTLMPGLIDAHWHTMFAGLPIQQLLTADSGYIHLAAAAESHRTLMRGFTTIRDLGGPIFAFKQAVDQGLVPGPRIYPSGAMITTSGGHGDLRAMADFPRAPGSLTAFDQAGGAAIVDSPDEIRMRVREQLAQGASQIKLVGGGGVSTPRSPLDIITLTEPELRAAVEAATGWNTFATIHAYTPNVIQRAIACGVRCIEHAHLMDDATAQMMAEKDIWLSIQPFLDEQDTGTLSGPSRVAALQVFAGTDTAYKLAIRHGIRTAFGSDLLFSPALATRQGTMLTHLTRWYSNAEILTMATATNADLLALSGPRNPYPGTLGRLVPEAYADMILVDGDPLRDITPLATPETSLKLIMKDGVIHKNTLA